MTENAFEALNENLRFMVAEVTTQVEQAWSFLVQPSRRAYEKINSRDNYIDTLKSLIEERTFQLLMSRPDLSKSHVNYLRALLITAGNLERIGDFAVNIARQVGHLSDPAVLDDYDLDSFLEEVITGLGLIFLAFRESRTDLAYRICQSEYYLDRLYAEGIGRVLDEVRQPGPAGDPVTTLLIIHYAERMGDSLLNIGEAVLFAIVGEKMKIQQYQALRDGLASSGLDTTISQVEFQSIWGTRSGCRIGTVQEDRDETPSRPIIFKHGNNRKLKSEKRSIDRWQRLIPDLAPRIAGFLPGDDDEACILLEYIHGCTFQDLIVNGNLEVANDALFMIEEVVRQVWRATLKPDPVSAGFIGQIRDRAPGVYRIHPQLKVKSARIGSLVVPSFYDLLDELEPVESELAAPFSVLIHGDFNINNIIYNDQTEKVHFIDLHRSRETDYVQDVATFLVSNFRMPFFTSEVRERLNNAILTFFGTAREFARENGDETLEARLALGLARSLFTSTRFEMNKKFAKLMALRSAYLLEKLVAHRGRPWSDFRLPLEALKY